MSLLRRRIIIGMFAFLALAVLTCPIGCLSTNESFGSEQMLVTTSNGIWRVNVNNGASQLLIKSAAGKGGIEYYSAKLSPDRRTIVCLASGQGKNSVYSAEIQRISVGKKPRITGRYQFKDTGNAMELGFFPNKKETIWALPNAEEGCSQFLSVADSPSPMSIDVIDFSKIHQIDIRKNFPYFLSFSPDGIHVACSTKETTIDENDILTSLASLTSLTSLRIGTLTPSSFKPGEVVLKIGETKDDQDKTIDGYIGGHAWISKNKIAVLIFRPKKDNYPCNFDADIWFVELNDHGVRSISRKFPAQSNPLVAPDGKNILVFRGVLGKGSWFEIYDSEGKFVRRIPNSFDADMSNVFCWSSPSTKVASPPTPTTR